MDKKMCLSWTKKYFVPSVPFVDKILSWKKPFRVFRAFRGQKKPKQKFVPSVPFVDKILSWKKNLPCLSWTNIFRGKKPFVPSVPFVDKILSWKISFVEKNLSCLPCLSWTKFFAEKYLSWKKKPFVPFVPSVPFVDKKNRAFRGPISSVDKKQFLCSLAYFWPHP